MARHKRVQLDAAGYEPGDPAVAVLGREEERPARVHGPQRPKPPLGANGIRGTILARLEELKPLVEEYGRLEAADKALEAVLSPPPAKPKQKRRKRR